MKKPPYRVPTMKEIARVKPNGLSLISTFAGCGGSSLGYRLAGFKVRWASEFVEAARIVYEANAAKGTIVDGRDIRKVEPLEVLKTIGLKVGELDVLDGSPPCASFSTSGKREVDWGKSKTYSDTEQRTDDLFFEFIRFLKAMKPRAFVAENVSGLIKGTSKGYFIEILAAMKACGYVVEARLLDAQWLGVPQTRQRVIFIGTRKDLKLKPAFPAPLPYRYGVRDAFVGLPAGPAVEGDAPSIDGLAIGREYDKLNLGETSKKFFNLKRAPLAEPSQTITAQGGGRTIASVCHPTERRKFSIAELKRITGFPDDFKLSGTYEKQWERLGRAVPPMMMKAIAETIAETLGGLR